jgi:nicotinamidase-related amidase
MRLEARKTAVLGLDLQEGIFGFAPEAAAAVPAAAAAMEAGRKAGALILHVGLGFEPGYPEVSPAHPRFGMLKEKGLFLKGSDSARFHRDVYRAGETIVYKHRVSGFSGNALRMILTSRGIENLVLFGIATSGIVLSTLREASDLDYRCVVVKDACADRDAEVHRVLAEKVFPAQAEVVTADKLGTLL